MKSIYKAFVLGFVFSAISSAAYSSYVAFEDHFDGAMSPEWISVEPVQWVEDGWLHTQDDYAHVGRDSSAFVNDGNGAWRDYTLSMRVDPIPTAPDWEDARVFFRTSNVNANYYGVSGNYYMLNVRGPDHGNGTGPWPSMTLLRVNGSTPTTLFQEVRVPYIDSDPMDLEITLNGARIQVALDGDGIIDVIDPDPLLFGGIGIGAVWEAEARFDDVVVTVVPIPGSILLMGTGLVFFGAWAKKKLTTNGDSFLRLIR
jgi:hypothetical protein